MSSRTHANAKPAILPQHLAKLRSCGLTDETIKVSGIRSERDPERLQRILCWVSSFRKCCPVFQLNRVG